MEKAHDVLRGLAIESGASEDIEMIQMREKDRIIMYGLPGTLENIKDGSFPESPPSPDTSDESTFHNIWCRQLDKYETFFQDYSMKQ